MGAIALGLCNVAVIAYGSTQRSVGRKQVADALSRHVHMPVAVISFKAASSATAS